MAKRVYISNKGPIVNVHIPDFSGLGSSPVVDIDSGIVSWILYLREVYFINGHASVSMTKWLELIPIFVERGMSIWQESKRLI